MEVIDLVDSALISNELTQMINFLTRIPDRDSHSPALLDMFLSSDVSICSIMAFPLLKNSDRVVFSVFIDFLSNSKRDAPLHHIAYDYSFVDWDGPRDHLRAVPWEDIFKLSASAAASEFCEWVHVGIDVHIPYHKYQVKPHSSSWFSAACAAAAVNRNHFFVCTKTINLLNLKESSGRLVMVAKGFLKLPNLHMITKQKSPSIPRNSALRTFGKFVMVFSAKINLLFLLYSTVVFCIL